MQRVIYRSYQFFSALKATLYPRPISRDEQQWLEHILPTPPQQQLFNRMSANDQRHALAVAHTLRQVGYDNVALLQAALLHDVGKSLGQPILHRVLIVLLEAFWPRLLERLSSGPSLSSLLPNYVFPTPYALLLTPHFFFTPFLIHAQHPQIGAAWAEAVACDPLAIRLMARHQDHLPAIFTSEDELLALLQWADGIN